MPLFTLGYEGRAIEDVILCFKKARVDLVVDVRALPLSRKPGFSKNAFARHLADAGIAYAHRVALGTPKPMRARYKRDHDFGALRVAFEKYLAHQEIALDELVDLVKGRRACLVCFEADPELCHRSIVADHARRLGVAKVEHLHP